MFQVLQNGKGTLNSVGTYALDPQGCQLSFYGKAKVETAPDGSAVLYSYEIPVMMKTKTGALIRLWNGWSQTTNRHINAFVGHKVSKAFWNSMEVNDFDRFKWLNPNYKY